MVKALISHHQNHHRFIVIELVFIVIQWDINGIYPLVICYIYIAIENGPVEIVDFAIKNSGSLHS